MSIHKKKKNRGKKRAEPVVNLEFEPSSDGLHHHRVLVLGPLGDGAERPRPPHAQGVVRPRPWRGRHVTSSLALRRRVALVVTRPVELALPAGGRQERHERVNAVERVQGSVLIIHLCSLPVNYSNRGPQTSIPHQPTSKMLASDIDAMVTLDFGVI